MQQNRQFKITQSRLLLVEGQDDSRFFGALLRYLNREDIQVGIYEGKDNLRPFLKGLPAVDGFSQLVSLGLTRDADSNADSTFQSVHDALENAGLPAPNAPLELQPGQPRTAVMIMPPGETSGALEDLCLRAVSGHPAMSCVDAYFECVQRVVGELPQNQEKARVQAFLASQKETVRLIGEAADKGYWQWDSDVYEPVRRFIDQL